MTDFLRFLALIGTELYDLFAYAQRPAAQRSVEQEHQLALRIVRRASDEMAKREIEEP